MKKIIIAGGGVSGLSAAAFLSQKNYDIELIEASPAPGGRTRSFLDPELGTEIDNGQHLLMGCYKNTLEFLAITGGIEGLSVIDKLKIPFVGKDKKITYLQERIKTYPLNLISALLNFKLLSHSERLGALLLITKLLFWNEKRIHDISVKMWLEEKNQSRRICDVLWDPLVISTMNVTPDNASSKIFVKILQEIFRRGGSNLIIPKVGLSKVFVDKTETLLKKNGVRISCSERVTEVVIEGGRAKSISTSKRKGIEFDEIVFAVPPHSFAKISGIPKIISSRLEGYNYSPIITVYLGISENSLSELIYLLVNSKIQWVFNHGSYLSIVVSAAKEWEELDIEEIIIKTKKELEQYLGIEQRRFTSARVIKEKRATIVLDPEMVKERSLKHGIKNLHIVGDWTNTGLPATIEGGIFSSKSLKL